MNSLLRLIPLLAAVFAFAAAPMQAHTKAVGYAVDNGDVNGDLRRNLIDPLLLLQHLFHGTPAPVALAFCGGGDTAVTNGDADGNGRVELLDVVRLIRFVVLGRPAPVAPCARGTPRVVPGDVKAYGLTYGEWSAEWWKWTYGAPEGSNPVKNDLTGAICDFGQSGDAWFLAGSFGISGVVRTCTVPAGKAIFYPVINSAWIDCPNSPDEDLTEQEVRDIMAQFTGAGDLACVVDSEVDGISVVGPNHPAVRTQSPVFTMMLPENHIVGGCDPPIPPGPTGRLVSEGHWIMLAPLSAGDHTLYLRGAGCDPATGEIFFQTEVTYHLTVE